jgi:hypothetical protein
MSLDHVTLPKNIEIVAIICYISKSWHKDTKTIMNYEFYSVIVCPYKPIEHQIPVIYCPDK